MASGAIRDSDHPWNAWPSLHVVHVILLAGLVDRWTAIEDRAIRRPVLALVVALSCCPPSRPATLRVGRHQRRHHERRLVAHPKRMDGHQPDTAAD